MRLVFKAVLPNSYNASKYPHDGQGSSALKKSGRVVTIGGGGSKGFRSRQDSKYGIMDDDDATAFATSSASPRPAVSVDIGHNHGGSYSGSLDEIPLTGITKETHVTWMVEDSAPAPGPHRDPRV